MTMWTPSCYLQDKIAINNSIVEIYNHLKLNSTLNKNTSLLAGSSGICLFLYYYYKYSGNFEAKKIADSYLDEIIESFDKDIIHNYIEGSIGKAWLINHLNSKCFIKTNKNIFKETDKEFYKIAFDYLESNSYDLFYGALGIIHYFISSKKTKYIKGLINKLISIAKKDNKSLFWDTDSPKGNAIFFGLAHGQASIYSIINKAITEFNFIEYKKELFQSISFTTKICDLNKSNLLSSVPNYITDTETSFDLKLSWCNGDLGLFYKLLQIAKIQRNLELEKLSLSALKRTLIISTPEKANIHDSILCHGTTGTALIYSHLYNETLDIDFLKSAQNWWRKTLEMKTHIDGCAGFKFFDPESGYFTSSSLLQGISGVGLSLISSVSKIAPSWDECLLLS